MKLALALCIAAAAATAPPRIELNLNAIQASFLEKHSAVGGTGTWERFHTIAGTNARGVQDYTERCPAGTGTNKVNCPIPIAHAWDSKNGEIKVNEQIYLVDDDGTPGVVPVKHVKYDGRRTYIIKYDATDDAGNKAEQLVFALILDDIKAPRISCDDWSSNGVTCDCKTKPTGACVKACSTGADYVIEAAAGFLPQSTTRKPNWELCKKWHAFDIVQGYVDKSLVFKVTSPKNPGQPIYEGPSRQAANKALTGDKFEKPLGRYTLTVTAKDNAGDYGKNGQDNVATHTTTFIFQDTQSPSVVIQGDAPNHNHECGKKYTDAGAKAFDAYDGTIDQGVQYGKNPYTGESKGLSVSSNVNQNKKGAYTVTYTARDSANNWAKAKRYVLVHDTAAPNVALVGDSTVTRYVQKDDLDRYEEPGITVHDDCDTLLNGQVFTQPQAGSATAPKISMTWSKNAKGETPDTNVKVTGTFVRTYRAWDTTSNGKYTQVKRTFIFVDNEEPYVKLVGKATVTISACDPAITGAKSCKPYTDEGARCFDYVGGEMAQKQITKVGNTVVRKVPGTYKVSYRCKDNAKKPNFSEVVSRTVIVKDMGCPKIFIQGANPTIVEANFPFVDAGAYAEDNLDGRINWSSGRIHAVGNTVNTKSLFVQARSCKDIQDQVASANSGSYYITSYNAKKGFFRMKVFCDMNAKPARTYKVNSGEGAAVVPYGSAQGNCGAHGLKMAELPLSGDAAARWTELIARFQANKQNPTNVYLCESDEGLIKDCSTVIPHKAIHWAEYDATKTWGPYLAQSPTRMSQAACIAACETNSACAGWAYRYGDKRHEHYKKCFLLDASHTKYAPKDSKGAFNSGVCKRRAVSHSSATKLALGRAEPGTYHISYHFTDSSGLSESSCGKKAPVRVVKVRDTLAPVISLHLKGKLLKSSNVAANDANPENPAWSASNNPFLSDGYFEAHDVQKALMAEETSQSVSGWVIGAVASAVAGIALLAASRRPTAVATSVPI